MVKSQDLYLEVVRREYHYFPACPCNVCEAERIRRGLSAQPVKVLSVDATHQLGLIKRRSPGGSRVRELMTAAGRQ